MSERRPVVVDASFVEAARAVARHGFRRKAVQLETHPIARLRRAVEEHDRREHRTHAPGGDDEEEDQDG